MRRILYCFLFIAGGGIIHASAREEMLNTFDDEEMRKLALCIRSLDASDEDIARFIEYTKVKGGIEYARQAMVDYRNKALALLPQSAGQAVKDALTAYIDYVIERDK